MNRRRRRLVQTLTWPVALLIVGRAMGWIAFLLASWKDRHAPGPQA